MSHKMQKSLPHRIHSTQTKGIEMSEGFCSMTRDMVNRLGMVRELSGHLGCVNCIQWNRNGRLLASGADDKRVIVWDGLAGKMLTKLKTLHEEKILSLAWLPGENQLIATGAGDNKVAIINIETSVTLTSVNGHSSHNDRVGTMTTSPDSPGVVLSGGDDGMVRQWDLREKWSQDSANVLVDLEHGVTSIAVCPGRSELLAVGARDPYVRLFDVRKITRCQPRQENATDVASEPMVNFIPGHLFGNDIYTPKLISTSSVAFNSDGTELLCNLNGEQIYLYDKVALFSTDETEDLTGVQNCNSITNNNYLVTTTDTKQAFKTPPDNIEKLNKMAAAEVELLNYTKALTIYNQAIELDELVHPDLNCNRASVLKERGWDGDVYAALRDYKAALSVDPDHHQAHLGVVQCLTLLSMLDDAKKYLDSFKERHPAQMTSSAFTEVVEDLNNAKNQCRKSQWKDGKYRDYSARYVGANNILPYQVNEANFLGRSGQFVMAASDDGNIFIWDRKTTNLVKVLKGDKEAMCCLQVNPTSPVIATSGNDDAVVRIWEPLPEDGEVNPRVVEDLEQVSAINNKEKMDPNSFAAACQSMLVNRHREELYLGNSFYDAVFSS